MEAGAEFLGDKRCPVCGKRFTVLWPHLWGYKRKNAAKLNFYCSWKCLRANEIKAVENQMERKHIITKEIKEKAVQLAMNGEDPKPYLKECGCSDPVKAWGNIKQRIKKEDPNKYAELMQKTKTIKASEIVEAMIKSPEAATIKNAITKPLGHSGMKAIGWRGATGKFFYDEEHDRIDFDNGADELSMSVEGWRKFLQELTTAAQLMGVEL